MKKFFTIILSLMLMVIGGISLVGCKDNNEQVINIYMPDGAPALSMSKLMYDNDQFDTEVNYTVVSSSNIANTILNKTADIAILPVNAASKILGDNYKIVATVTNGNLFVVGNKNISSLSDLSGEVIGVIGQGNVPDLNFRYLLSANSVEYETSDTVKEDKVAIRYFADASNLLPLLKQNKLNFGLLPEPAVSKLLSMASNFSVELDIQAIWEGGSYPQAVMVAKTSLIEDNNQLIENIISKMIDSEDWIIENSADAVTAVNNNVEEGVVPSLQTTISSTAIENCNIRIYTTKDDSEKSRIKSYWEKIKTVNSSAIGNYTDNLFW
jgi:ABC-type amino acid transport substrate-binding protein